MEEELFVGIISMCSTRILQRLRLIPSKRKPGKPKKPIKLVLQNVMEYVKRIKIEKIPDTDLQSTMSLFRTKAKDVVRLIDSWHGHQTPTRLGVLVKGVYNLHQVTKLSTLLDLIPTLDMQHNAKISLLNTISKVARYREAARILYRTAKKIPSARQMTAVPVKLPEEAFSFASYNTYTPSLLSTVTRIDKQYHHHKLFSRVCHLLNTTVEEASSQFSGQVRRTLREAKIHAEIQLVTYCELQKPKLPPRVFCSSKDACFLCSSFILLYKKLYTLRCHGRLYPGWWLPSLLPMKEMEQRFNEAFEGAIKKSLSMLSTRQQKTSYPCPNESTLLTIPLSETTRCSSVQHESDTVDMQPSLFKKSQMISQSVAGAPPMLPQTAGTASTHPQTDSGFTNTEGTPRPECLSTSKPHRPQSNKEFIEEVVLSQGSRLHSCMDSDRTSPLYIAGPLKIEIEYVVGLKSIEYSIEWLTEEDMGKVPEGLHPLFDAESIVGEVSLQNQNGVYITAKGIMLKLAWHPKTA